MIGASEQILLT